jgi:hypothetical protein
VPAPRGWQRWNSSGLIWIGAGLFFLGIVVGAALWKLTRDDGRSSIISQSMHYRK